MAVVIQNLTGRSGGLMISNLNVPYEHPSSVNSTYFLANYKFESDTLYLVVYKSNDTHWEALYYDQTGKTISHTVAKCPLLTLHFSSTSNSFSTSNLTMFYNLEDQTITASGVNPITYPTLTNEWRFYKIPLNINFSKSFID